MNGGGNPISPPTNLILGQEIQNHLPFLSRLKWDATFSRLFLQHRLGQPVTPNFVVGISNELIA